MTRATPLLAVRHLNKRFRIRKPGFWSGRKTHITGLNNISFDMTEGEAVGLVGASGSGKSTLAKIVARLLEPDTGQIWMDGHIISEISQLQFTQHPLRRHIQMVFQDHTGSLSPRYTAAQLIADPCHQLMPMPKTDVEARVRLTAAKVGLSPDLLTRYPHQLSGGQKARVGIARALILEPRLLILDEPTSSLDASVQAMVLKLLDQLRRENGIALLFISHDLHIIRLLCQRVLVMERGQIIETGPANELFNAPQHPATCALIKALF